MDLENPYEAPESEVGEIPSAPPHSASIRKEAWRGAKFGAKIGAYIAAAMVLMVVVVTIGLFCVATSNGKPPKFLRSRQRD